MRSATWVILLGAVALLHYPLHAGTVAIAPPTVESNRYEFPIALDNGAAGAASMDFRLRYDPEVFTPVRVVAGPSATAAGKVVDANLSEPGAYSVLVMGLNQNSLPPGEVARVVMRRNPESGAAESRVSVESPTLADGAGSVLAASGSGRLVRFREDDSRGDAPGGETAEGESPAETPAQPSEPEDGAAETPAADPPGGDTLRDGVGQEIADALLAGLSKPDSGAGASQSGGNRPGDPSARVSGEETPEMKYSIREGRWPVEILQTAQALPEAAAAETHGEVETRDLAGEAPLVTSEGSPEISIAQVSEEHAHTIEPRENALVNDGGGTWGDRGESAPGSGQWTLVAIAAAIAVVILAIAWRIRNKAARS